MKNALLLILPVIAASTWSCGTDSGKNQISEQKFTAAHGIYYGAVETMQADSLRLIFEAGQFTDGRPVGEAKRLTVTCYVPAMPENEIYLPDGEYTAASAKSKLPVFIPGSGAASGVPDGTYLESWIGTASVTLFTGGTIEVSYSEQTGKYTITASLTDAEGNTFATTYMGELELSLPKIEFDEKPSNMRAIYYGGNNPKTKRWLLDLFGDDSATGGYTGMFLDICADRVFDGDASTLQEGEYRVGTEGATGTYLPGGNDNGSYVGSYYYKMDKSQNVIGGMYITGGIFTIARDPETGKYTVTAVMKGKDMTDASDIGKSIEYKGIPTYVDMSSEESHRPHK